MKKEIKPFYKRQIGTIINIPVINNKEIDKNIKCIINNQEGKVPIEYFTKKFEYIEYPFEKNSINYVLNNTKSNLEACNLLSGKKLIVKNKIKANIIIDDKINQQKITCFTKISIFEIVK